MGSVSEPKRHDASLLGFRGETVMQYRIKLWDTPTRLFHWSLVLLFGVMWWSGETGGDALRLHLLAGYGIAGLLLFRLLWGVLGSDTARFARFVRGPGAMLAYLRGSLPEHRIPGHNPLGALMVLALLGLLGFQVGSGLFATDVDSFLWDGPLAKLINSDLSEAITGWHKISFKLLLAAVGLHLSAIVFYRLIKRRNLVVAMLSGWQTYASQPPELRFASWKLAVLCALVAAGVVAGVVNGLGG
jgi:cytochrome b